VVPMDTCPQRTLIVEASVPVRNTRRITSNGVRTAPFMHPVKGVHGVSTANASPCTGSSRNIFSRVTARDNSAGYKLP
jgi:hypothetical protein